MYSGHIITPNIETVVLERDTLPQLVALFAGKLDGFDTIQRVRRELARCGLFSRGYRLKETKNSVSVIIYNSPN